MHNIKELQTLEHENLGDIVYRKISEALMRGRFAPGTRLTIRELSTSLGTSVTPVRDAILRLIQDKALIQKSPREVRVPVLTPDRYCEIRDIRVRLEGLAVRNTVAIATLEDIQNLKNLIKTNELAIREERWLDALECNQLFHSAFAEITNMKALATIQGSLWLQVGPLIAGAYRLGGRAMIDDHYSILEAIENRNADAAEAAIGRDIVSASEIIIKELNLLANTNKNQ